jgi:hypothetical protein
MRTTLTLEPDVAQLLTLRMAQKKQSLKRAVNEALRIGLAANRSTKEVPYTVKPHPFRFKPGIDMDKLGQLVDELETEETIRKLQK